MAVERHSEFAAVAAEWDALGDRLRVLPWLRPAWFEAWWRAFGGDGRPELVAVRRGSRLVALAPLVRRGRTLASLTNWHSPGFALLGEDAAAHRELAEALVDGETRRLSLAFCDRDDGLAACRAAAGARGFRVLERVLQRSPYLVVRGAYERYLNRLDRHHVKEVARRRRRLSEQGELRFEVHDGREGLDTLLAEGFAVEGSGWKRERGTAIDSRGDTLRFYTDVARWAAERGILRLCFLRLDGRPIAFEFAFEDAGAYAIPKGGFDVEFRRYGPGMLITDDELRRAFSKGVGTYEFLGGDDEYKLVWTREVRERVAFDAFAPSPAGLAGWAAQAYARPLAKAAVARARAARGA